MSIYADGRERLRRLISEARGAGQKAYAAALYVFPRSADIDSATIVASAYNTERTSGNSNAHAEINVLNMAAKILTEAIFDSQGREIPVGQRTIDFCLLVNTRPCPKCTAAIADCQVFNVYFYRENGFMKSVSEAILAAKTERAGRDFVFKQVPSEFVDDFESA